MSLEEKSKIIARFPLASASNRFFSRLLDMFIVIGISIGLGFAIICTDPVYQVKNSSILVGETWRYFLVALISAIISFFYFIIVPFFWKGQTLMKKLFKLSSHNFMPLNSFFFGLVKHELFIWVLLVLINIIFSLTLWGLGPEKATELIKDINVFSPNKNTTGGIYIAAIVFSTFYMIVGMIDIVLVILLFIKNKKANAIDNFSNIVVIKLIDISGDDINATMNKKSQSKKINYGLPGEINDEVIEEISQF